MAKLIAKNRSLNKKNRFTVRANKNKAPQLAQQPQQKQATVSDTKKDKSKSALLLKQYFPHILGSIMTIAAICFGIYNHTVSHHVYKREIYGQWIEQHMPSSMATTLTISQNGIAALGRVLATDFDYDGEKLVFWHRHKEHRFQVVLDKKRHIIGLKEITKSKSYRPFYLRSTVKPVDLHAENLRLLKQKKSKMTFGNIRDSIDGP